mgnify:FL=1
MNTTNENKGSSVQLKKDLVIAGVCLAGVAIFAIYMEKHTRSISTPNFVAVLGGALVAVPVILTLKYNS